MSKGAPHSLDAERAVLGAALMDPAVLPELGAQLSAADFYLERHRRIWGMLQAQGEAGQVVDLLTVAEGLKVRGDFDQVGGLSYLSSLLDNVPLTSHAGAYAGIVREKALLRRLGEVGAQLVDQVAEGTRAPTDILDQAHQALTAVAVGQEARTRPVCDLVPSAFAGLEALYDRQGQLTGISTGLRELDRILAGMQRSDLIILAARPSLGKTALALNILAHVGIARGLPAVMFSLEMSERQLMTRLLGAEARVESSRLRTGNLDEEDWRCLARAAERIYPAPIYIDDQAAITLPELRARCRRLHVRQRLGLVVVDYLQLMGSAERQGSREQEIAQLSRGLKALAKELDVPVLALSQLNRKLEDRPDKRPRLSDLRESGAIEQDADVILFIHRDAAYRREGEVDEEDGGAVDENAAEIIIAKQRNGPVGTVNVAWMAGYMRFENLAGEA